MILSIRKETKSTQRSKPTVTATTSAATRPTLSDGAGTQIPKESTTTTLRAINQSAPPPTAARNLFRADAGDITRARTHG